jgi:hypothetical protein
MKKLLYTLITATVLILASSATHAQMGSNDQIEQLLLFLEQNDEILERASDAVRATNVSTPLAEMTLRHAVNLQVSAWKNYEEKRYSMAYSLARKARDKANAVLAAIRQTHQDEGETVVLRRLERAADLLDRAKGSVADGHRKTLRTLYETANSNLHRAWEFYRNGQYRPALKLADQVEKTAQKILTMNNATTRGQQQFERRLENSNQLMDRARSAVADCGSEAARRLMDRAGDALMIARKMEQESRPMAALQALKNAREMAQRALAECQGSDQLMVRYERLRQSAEALMELVSNGSGQAETTAKRLIEQAYDQLEMAKSYIDKGKPEQALPSLQATELALRQAQKYIENH